MTREFRFRVWDKSFRRMKVTGIGINQGVLSGDDVEIMQFTGLLDKNGKHIYEGDIVRFQWGGKTHIIVGVVEWDMRGRFVTTPYVNGQPMFSINGVPIATTQVEVIGNIWEHSHLLEATK